MVPAPVLRNRNRNRNLITGLREIETVSNYNSGTGTRGDTLINGITKVLTDTVQNCVFDIPYLTVFSFTFYNKYDENYHVKRRNFFRNFLKLCFLLSRYGAGTGTITFQKSEPEPQLVKSRNRNRQKNSYDSAKLINTVRNTPSTVPNWPLASQYRYQHTLSCYVKIKIKTYITWRCSGPGDSLARREGAGLAAPRGVLERGRDISYT